MDVEAILFPRVDLTKIGLAPSTSMFYFDANGRAGYDDYRPQVHDSDGLLILNGRGERLWRPLANPKTLQISAFLDVGPRGFGLMQRDRDFTAYEDLESAFERRPSLWVEPVGDWGQGSVTLVEIPSNSEVNDNIVAFWQPQAPIAAGSEYSFAYRLSWGNGPPQTEGGAIVSATRRGRADLKQDTPPRLFVIDYVLPDKTAPRPAQDPKATVTVSAGKVSHLVIGANPMTQGWRITFQLDPESADSVELRLVLAFTDGRPAEIWVYRWTA
jgi:glucans biosynthesis protein